MKDTFTADFPSQGFIKATLDTEELAPIQKEIDSIQKDFNSAKINDLGNASNLKNEFYLQDCLEHIEHLLNPLCQKYCEFYAFGDRSKHYTLNILFILRK